MRRDYVELGVLIGDGKFAQACSDYLTPRARADLEFQDGGCARALTRVRRSQDDPLVSAYRWRAHLGANGEASYAAMRAGGLPWSYGTARYGDGHWQFDLKRLSADSTTG